MDNQFWIDVWQTDEQPFHKTAPNEYLVDYLQNYPVQAGQRVFVPLCGKTLDMHFWRSKGVEVWGVELSEVAIESFFKESQLEFSCSSLAGVKLYSGSGFQILCGDILELRTGELPEFDWGYDRAAFIALPPKTRQKYAKLLGKVINKAGARIFMHVMQYQEQDLKRLHLSQETLGPPYSIMAEEVPSCFTADFQCKIMQENLVEAFPKAKEQGFEQIWQRVYVLERGGGDETVYRNLSKQRTI